MYYPSPSVMSQQLQTKAAYSAVSSKSSKKISLKPKPAGVFYPHKYKTQMCKNFEKSKTCAFGRNCNYAHGEEQLNRYTAQ